MFDFTLRAKVVILHHKKGIITQLNVTPFKFSLFIIEFEYNVFT